MKHKNTFVKKLTALVLCLCMVLPMVTTGFAPMMALLDGIAPQAEATVTEKGKVAFYVPEVIYLYPNATSWRDATSTPFQYYIENTVNTSDIYAQPTTNTELRKGGTIYFAAENGFSDVSITHRFMDESFNTITGGSITVGSFSNSSSYGTFSITDGKSPSLSATTTGCYIEWTVSYTNSAGERQSAIAYTYVYKPYTVPFGGAVRAVNQLATHLFSQQITWVSGVHKAETTAIYYPRFALSSSGSKGMAAFLSKDNVGYIGTSAVNGTNTSIALANVSPYTGAELRNTVFATTSADTSYFFADQTGSDFSDDGSADWFESSANTASNYGIASFDYHNHAGDGGKAYRLAQVDSAAAGRIYVDTSRYGNLSQIPNLGVGLLATDAEANDGTDASWYVADMTGYTTYRGDQGLTNSDTTNPYYSAYNYKIAGQGNVTSYGALSKDNGIMYAGTWPREISGTGDYKYTVKGFFGTWQESPYEGGWWRDTQYALAYSIVDLHVTQHDKGDLRTAINNAINAMGTLGLKDNYGSYYYDTNNTAWQTFKTAYREAAMGLTKLDGSVEVSTLATNLNNAVTALKAGQGRKIYFDVNYNGIKPNLYILGSAATGNYGLSTTYNNADESVTINGTTSGSNEFGTTPFTPIVDTYTFSTYKKSGSWSGAGCAVLDAGKEDKSNVSTRTYYNFTGTNFTPLTFTATTAPETDLLRFWAWQNGSTADTYSNLTARIKVEKGNTNNPIYSPVARVADGTYGTLPDLANATRFPEHQRNGYTFKGWATTPTGTTAVSASTAVSSDTLYAIWEPIHYTITYNTGCTNYTLPSNSADYTKVNDTTYTQTYTIEDSFVLFNPTRTGYKALNWVVTVPGGIFGTGDEAPGGTPMAANKYYGSFSADARWTPINYTVKFNANGGTGTMADLAMTYDTAKNLTVNTFTREGYDFAGWATLPNGTETTYTDGQSVSNLTAADGGVVTLYARWTPAKQYLTVDTAGGVNGANLLYPDADKTNATLNFNPDGINTFSGGNENITYSGTIDEYGIDISGTFKVVENSNNPGNAVLETTTMLPLWVYLEQGKTYEYSYTASNEKTSLYLFRDGAAAIRASVSRHSGTTYSGVFVLGEKNAYNTGDTTWDTVADATGYYQLRMDQDHEMSTLDGTSYSYSISDLVIREVTPDAQSKYQQPNGSKIILNDPVRGGYTFGGWEFSGTQYGTLDGIFYTFGVNADTLVAKWNKNNYTLTYDANGGSLTDVNSTTYTADDTITIATAPTRAGYTFNGWLVSDADGNWIENGTCHPGETASGMYGNVTLKAQWSANTVDYKVEHYKMNESGSDYVLAETEYLQGETDTDAAFSEKEYTGFAYKEAKVGDTVVTSATIAGDGTLVIELYYDREQYTVKVVAGSGVKSVSGGGSYYYDTKLAISAVPEDGYGNIVWKDADGNSIDLASYKVTGEVTLTASASANDVQYKVIHRVENADGTFTDTTETFTAKTDSSVSPDVNDYGAGFNMPSVQTVTVTGDGNTVVTYEYTRKEFTLTLDYGNGTSVAGMLKYGATINYPSEQELTKEGYSFVGWSPENITTMPAQNTLITAQWQADTYTISYDLAGGSIDGTNPASYTVDTADFTLVNPTRRGYTFAGWTGTGLDETSTSVTVAKGSMGNRSYTATWTLNEYTITVDNADGTPTQLITYTVNSAAITIGPLTRTGYTFGGWTGTDLASAQQSITIDPATDALKDRTFVANWTANTNTEYKVYTYYMGTDGNYPTDVKPEVRTGTTGDPVTITPATVTGFTATQTTVSGYIKADGSLILNVYYQRNKYNVNLTAGNGIVSLNGSGSYYYDAPVTVGVAEFKPGYTTAVWTYTGTNDQASTSFTMPDKEVNLTATATPIEYNISYELAGGTVAGTNPTSYTVETASFKLINPTRTGYTFAGWTGTDFDEASTSVTVEKGSVGDRAYTATWTPITYTIAYELNGGKLADGVTNPENYTIETDTFTLSNPTKVGYAFAGWTGTGLTEAAVQVEIATGSTGNREYTATWNVSNANYTVIYYTEDLGADTFSQLGETEVIGSVTGTEIKLDSLKKTIEGFTFSKIEDQDDNVLAADPTVAADGSTIIKLYYTRNSHTLTYYITKGENETAVLHQAFENVEFGATIPTVADPVRTGYSFQGWKDIDTIPTMPDQDVDILALWDPNVFTISYALDGGDFAADVVVPDKHTYDTTTPIPNPEKLGYDFAGWKTGDKELGKNYTVKENDFTADFTLTATWTPVEQDYTVEYYFMDTKGENYVLNESKTEKGKLATGSTLNLTPETVTGFSLNEADTVLDTPMPPEGNLVLKVYYDRNQYKLTLVAGDGIASVPEEKSYYYQADVSFTASMKTGYAWSSWTNTADGTVFSTTQQQVFTMPAYDLSLTANATPITYNIEVDAMGGTLVSDFTKDSYIVTDDAITVPNATKPGYIFNGWSLNGAAAKTGLVIDTAMAVDVQLVASWTAEEYTIIYNGVENAVNTNPGKYTIETETFSLVEPTKTGYEFLGWTVDGQTTPTKNVTIEKGSMGKLEFIANWNALGIEYKVTLRFEGQTANNFDSFDETKLSAAADSQVTAAEVAPGREGFTYAYAMQNGAEVETFTVAADGTTEIELYYTRNSYKITFDADGGEAAVAEQSYKYGADVVAPADPTKTGYTFDGWDTLPETMPANDLTVTAQWTINQYTITFDTVGGTAIDPITQDYNTDVTAPADPTKTGYTFDGWYVNDVKVEVPATMPAENMTLTAKWNINSYTITFNTDGGTEVAAITKNYGEPVGTVSAPTKIGYTFTGWDVAVPGTMPAEDLTITATWRVNKYTITFDSDGGSAVDAITQDYNTDVTAPADPTRTGYTFKGWDKDIPATMPAENVTLKAQWQVNQYTITFCDADGTTVLRTVKQDYGTTVDTTYKPSRTGYTFAGWDKAIPATMPAENITIIASWNIVKYNIVYILDAKNDEYVETNHADNPTTYTVEDNIKLKDPTKVGYTFTGWSPTGEIAKGSTGDKTFTASWTANTDTEYTVNYWLQPVDGSTDLNSYVKSEKSFVGTGTTATTAQITLADIAGFTKPQETAEIYIKADGSAVADYYYTRNQYTVTFDTLGGSDIGMATYYYNATVKAPENNPTKTGYTFDGWDTLPETMPAQNITVKAIWTANSYEITYEGLENADEFAKTTAHTYGTATKIDKPTRNGYTFAGWVVNGAGDPVVDLTLAADGYTAPIALKAEWTANEQNYTVVYYYENLDGEYVESRRTTDNKAATDSPVTLTPATETGFTLNEDKSKLTGVIPVPGTTLELSVYYKRNSYTVTWDVEGVQKIETLKYGQTITKPADPTKTGYTFHAWNPEVPATMPAENKTFTAQFLAKTDTAYKVIHKIETLTDGMYEEKETENKIGTTASEVTPEVKTYEGFTAPQTKTVTIAADGSTVVEYLYTRNSYKVTIVATDAGLSTPTETQTLEYGDTLNVNVTVANGYKFLGWTSDNANVQGSNETNYTITVPASDVTLTAKAEIIKYTIGYELAGGALANDVTNPTEFYVTTEDFTLSNPEKRGYTFTGWTGSNGTTAEETVTVKKGTCQDLNYIANWSQIQYKITYDLAGGSVSTANPTSYNVTSAAITLNNPTKAGYEFTGWTGTDLDGKVMNVTIDANSVGHREYTATWAPKTQTYYVDLYFMDLNGAYPETADKRIALTAKTAETVTYTMAEETGFTIVDGTNLTVVDGKNVLSGTIPATDLASEALVLEGYYSRDQHTVTLADGDGIVSVSGAGTYYYGASVTVNAELMPGYAWVNWSNTDGTYDAQEYSFPMGTADVSLTANAKIIEYQISYDYDGGVLAEGLTNPTTYTVNTDTITLVNPTRKGYTFLGWTGTDLSAYTTEVSIEKGALGNRSYKANWSVNTYTLTIDPNGGTYKGNAEATVLNFTVNDTIEIAEPTRVGYTFTGWSDGTTTSREITLQNVAEDRTYTAQWSADSNIKYTVEHYKMNLDGEYDLTATETTVYENGVADGTVTPPVNAYTGFTAPEAQPVTVNPDGSTVVKYYYSRNKYTLTYKLFGEATSAKEYYFDAVVDSAPDTTVEGHTFAGWDKGIPSRMPAGDLVITGTWDINQYTITFNTVGGTAIEAITLNYGTDIIAPANPTKTGYTFAGWNVEIPATMPAENMTITANWTVNSYTITFNTDGGTEIAPITADYGTAITKPADPTKTGYTFGGWSVNIPTTMPAEDMTITALWNVNRYTVTFNTNGGTAIESVTADYGTPIAKPADPTKRGYTFKGWDAEIPATVPAENVTINAKWEINTYTITYINPNGSYVVGDYTNPTTYTVEDTIKLHAMAWAGYAFSCWVYRLDGQDSETTLENNTITNMVGNITVRSMWSANQNDWYVDVYYMNTDGSYSNTPDTVLTNPSGFQQFTGYGVAYDLYDSRTLLAGFTPDTANSITTGIIPGTDKLHLIAKYKRNQYTVTYDFANGTDKKVVTTYYEAKLEEIANPTRTGYTFAGWYDANGNKVDLPKTMPLGGGTYTAHWTANSYTLTLDENGGTAVDNITYDIEDTVTLPVLTRDGYFFRGWKVTTEAGNWYLADESYAAGTPVNGKYGSATLTAQWTTIQYTLTFDTKGGTVSEASLSYTIEENKQLPTPVRPGYTFNGWNVTAVSNVANDSGNVSWVVGNTYKAAISVLNTYGNATFEAQWTARTFTVATEMSNIDYVGNTTATVDVDYSATLTPAAGYELPETVTVTIGDRTAVVNTDYTWTIHTDGSATLTLVGASIIDNVTIKVDRKIITYTISYSGLENSTLDAENKHSYTVETDTFTLNNPKKVGYTFLGWTGTALANAEQTVTIEKGSVGNRAYTAIWQANLNDCTVEHYQQNIYDNEYTLVTADTKTVQIETDKYFEPAVNTYTGFKAPAAQRIFVKGDGAVTVKYYYDREVYNVSLDGTMEGVASVSGAGEYRYGYELTVNATVNSGYAWAGWTNADGTVVSAAPDYTITIGTADVALSANASIIEYTIAYDLDGGTATNPATYTVTTDTFTLNNPTREGYDFAGWVGSNGTTPSTVVTIANGSVGDKEYTAKWTPIVYTVSYELHNGTPQGDMPTTYTIKDALVTLQDPVRNGYDFLGWIGSNGETPEKNVSFAGGSIGHLNFEAVWQVQTHYYKVETYIMTTDGQYLNTPDAVTDPIASETDQEIVLTPDAKTGFTVDETLSKLTGVVDYKDELVLKIYYARNQYELNLTIDGNGITAVSPATKKVYYGAEVEILATVADGYTFAKWTSDTDKVEDSTKNPHKITMPAGNVNLTATATLNVYNINYFLNEGTNHANNPSTYTVLDEINIKQPTKLGYTFTGWTGTFNGMQVYIPAGETGDINLTANWQIDHYKITYDLAGGQLTEGKTNPEDYTVLDSFTLNNPERVGYTFNGWKGTGIDGVKTYVTVNEGKNTTGELAFTADWIADTDTKYTVNYWLMDIPSEVGVKTYTKDNDASFVGEATSDTDVTPQVLSYAGFTAPAAQTKNVNADGSTVFNFYYERNIYTYTFKADGYDDVVREYYYDYPVTAPSDPSRTGYEFKGWNPVVVDKMPAHDVVSVAQWKAVTYDIGYALNGGTATNRTTYTIEDAFTLTQPTKYGYTFLGWTGTNLTEPTLTVSIPAGTTGNRSYTANWEATRYEITYDLDGGTDNGENPISYTINDTVTLVNPVKPGYRFLGWKGTGIAGMSSYVTFSEQTGDRTYTAQWTVANNTPYTVRHHQQDIGANTYTLFEEEALTGTTNTMVMPKVKTYPGFTAPAAQTITILADGSATVDYYYTRNNYTIYFDSNGGTSVASQTYAFGETVVAPAAPSLLGYTFAGWTPAIPETMTAGNLYLTASWKANSDTPYTVYHYYQDTDCVSYPESLMETEYCYGETGAVVEVATRDKEGFTSPEKRTVFIAADGSRTVRYYYTRNTYTVTFVDHNDNILDLQSVVYGLPATPPVLADRAPDADGHYTFLGWSEDISFIHGYTTIKAMYTAEAHTPGADADCTQALVCTVCGYEIAPANGHMPVVQIPAVEPTCDKPGNTADSVCSVCGEVLSRYKVVPALGHDIGSWYVDVPATATETGILKRVCSRCDWSEIHEIPVLSDTPVVSIDITTSGSQAYVGTTYQLVTSIKPANAVNKQVLWESSDPDIASVTADGMLTSHKPGEVTFTVTTLDGLKTDSITINFFYSADNYNLVVVDLFGCNLVMNGKVVASEGATAQIIRVKAGDTLAFTLDPTTTEYLNQGGYILTANGSNVAPDANGVYYIYNVHENIEISALPTIGKPEFNDDQQYDTDEVPEKSIFAKILEFFERIMDWFRNLFK